MGHYSPPLHDGADASLAEGYAAPAGAGTLSINAVLSDAGKFAYKFSSSSTVDATLRSDPAYSPPEGDGTFSIVAALRRPLADMGYTSLYPVGFSDGAVPDSHNAELKNRVVFAAGFATQEVGGSGVRHVSRPLGVKHTPLFLSSVFVGSAAAPSHDGIKAILKSYGDLSGIGRPLVASSIYSDVIFARGISAELVSRPSIRETQRTIRQNGWDSCSVPSPYVTDTVLRPAGMRTRVEFGTPAVFNWDRYIPHVGFDARLFGAAYVQGGVKHVTPAGLQASTIGLTKVINTTANQDARPAGIAPIPLDKPNVSPRMLRPPAIYGTFSGFPVVQFPPQPRGWQSSTFGYPAIEDKARRARGEGFDSFATGYASIRDRAQKVLHKASNVTSIFGDVATRLKSQRLGAAGFASFETSLFAEVRSTRRYVLATGLHAGDYGAHEARNKTPSLAPSGWKSLAVGGAGIGWRVRYIYPPGQPTQQPPQPSLWQTPSIKPAGIAPLSIPPPFVWPAIRTVLGAGSDTSLFGKPSVGLSLRVLAPSWEPIEGYGKPRAEHGRRLLIADGAQHASYGYAWVSRGQRSVEPIGVALPKDGATHNVAGSRPISAEGFVATRWGARIIPEVQTLAPLGILGTFGLTAVRNQWSHLRPPGFFTHVQDFQRWGTPRIWNLRRFITMGFDSDSGLNPPAWPVWTAIANRNKVVGGIGANASRVPEPSIQNGARAIRPEGVAPVGLPDYVKTGMVAFRVRALPVSGLEAPHLSGWSNVANVARVLKPSGALMQHVGVALIENTTRAFSRMGAFDALVAGRPFVAYRVRTLTLDSRYAIPPPRIDLPDVQLSTRYLEAQGIGNDSHVGKAALSIHLRILYPRWTHRDTVGDPRIWNATPELATRGRMAEEFGSATVRLEWRPVSAEGQQAAVFGLARIADRTRNVLLAGANFYGAGRPTVVRVGIPPLGTQYIWLDSDDPVQSPDAGFGIRPPGKMPHNPPYSDQIGIPTTEQLIIYPSSRDEQTVFGKPVVTANSLYPDGMFWLNVGEPTIYAFTKYVKPTGIASSFGAGKPRLSPHTIYAPMEAPQQARDNHPGGAPTYINQGARFGLPGLQLRHRRVSVVWDYKSDSGRDGYGVPRVVNSRQSIKASGFAAMRFGWHLLDDGRPRTVEPFDTTDGMAFGNPTAIRITPPGPQSVVVGGSVQTKAGEPLIEPRDRTVFQKGRDSLVMGINAPLDNPYSWQGLRIGPLMPTIPVGMSTEVWGTQWISNRVRGLTAEGFDAFLSEYDYQQFDQRLRVKNAKSFEPTAQQVMAEGHQSSVCGWQQAKLMRHYIRPDGNSDQHRKGAPVA